MLSDNEAVETLFDQMRCIGCDPIDQCCNGWNVVDQTLRRPDRPNPGIKVACLEDPASSNSRNQFTNIFELTTATEDINDFAADRVAGDSGSVTQWTENQLCVSLFGCDDRFLHGPMNGGLFRAQEAGSHVDPVGAECERSDETPTVGKASGSDHGDGYLLGCCCNEDQPRNIILAWMAGTFESVDADAVDADVLCLDGMAHAGAFVKHLDPCCVKIG